MEICRNKKTSKVFIYLNENEDGEALMITPQGSVKALEYDLFTEPKEVDDAESFLSEGHINQAQYDTYRKYSQQDH